MARRTLPEKRRVSFVIATERVLPRFLGPYEILTPLGAGGMGEVYRALDKRLEREVAIKILPSEVSGDAARVARFEREARLTSQLNHPSIVAVYDVVREEGIDGIVMELVRGESLRSLLQRGSLPAGRAVGIAAGIADALAAAHEIGVVHRDLKPENVMIAPGDAVKVLDFGLAKRDEIRSDGSEVTTAVQVSREGQVIGTAIYMSPEQASGNVVDFRTDHFSLGLILFEMLSGKHPFLRGSTTSTVAAILVDEPAPPLEEIATRIPPSVTRVLSRCLAKQPRERYGSTIDLARDLADARGEVNRRPVVEGKKTPPRWLGWLAALLILGAIIIAAALMLRPSTLGAEGAAPPLQASIELGDLSLRGGEVAPPIAISPDRRHLVFAAESDSGTTPLRILDLRTGSTRSLEDTSDAGGFAWSPDGRAVAYLSEGKLKVAELDGAPPRVVCDAPPEGRPAWSGDTILFPRFTPPAGIYAVSSAGGTPRLVAASTMGKEVLFWPQFLPGDERFLALALMPRRGRELRVYSLDGTLAGKIPGIDSAASFADGHLLYVQSGVLLARPFDPRSLRLTGEARPVVEGIHHHAGTGLASFAVAGGGMLVWQAADAPSRLVWRDRSGNQSGVLAEDRFEVGRFSPRGDRYAVAVQDPRFGTADIWIYDLASGAVEKITYSEADEKSPVWMPDGSAVLAREDGWGGPPDIAMHPLPEGEAKLVVQLPGVQEPQDVSPDGKRLIFVQHEREGRSDLWIALLDGAEKPRPWLTSPFAEDNARFSPDGRWVAYESDLTGRSEIYVRPIDGGSARLVSSIGGKLPRWNPRGGELFFVDGNGRLVRVAVTSDGKIDRASAVPLFDMGDGVDYEPEGARFLVRVPNRSASPLRIVTDWRALLQGQPGT